MHYRLLLIRPWSVCDDQRDMYTTRLMTVSLKQSMAQGFFLLWEPGTSWRSNVQQVKKCLGPVGIPLKRGTSGARQQTQPCQSRWKSGGMAPWGQESCWSQTQDTNARLPQHVCLATLTDVIYTTWLNYIPTNTAAEFAGVVSNCCLYIEGKGSVSDDLSCGWVA